MEREEAIKVVRNIYQTDAEKEALETLIPELAESEDERIRKTLVEYFGPKVQLDFVRGVPIQKIRDWLEKQKEEEGYEAVPVESTLEYKLGFKAGKESEKQKEPQEIPLMNGDADLYFDNWRQKVSVPTFRQCFEEGIRYAQRLQKEQKPSINIDQLKSLMLQYLQEAANEKDDSDIEADTEKWARKILEYDFEQKQEWSDEDEEKLKAICTYLRDYSRLAKLGDKLRFNEYCDFLKSLRLHPIQLKEAYKDGFQTARHAMALAFMNFLDENRPEGKMGLSNSECEDIDKAFKEGDWAKIMRYAWKYSPPPKQEWSEEDEKMFWGFTAYVPNEELERLGVTRDDILKKLKSLRPFWKLS